MDIEQEKSDFSFEIVFENDLGWTQLNTIHAILNKSFQHRTDSFLYQPYAKRRPIARVLCTLHGEIVATSSFFDCIIRCEHKIRRIGGIGLTCSSISGRGIGNICRRIAATKISKLLGVDYCLSRVSEKTVQSQTARSIIYRFLKIPLIGRQSRSHPWEYIALYSPHVDEISAGEF